ncbi:MAG: hypothetical protein K2Y21_00440 [Phycisphaerales bacterium]|nr:hypothetical protein [Phycisphaerales bacterium]
MKKVARTVGVLAVLSAAGFSSFAQVYSNLCHSYCAKQTPNSCTFGSSNYCTGPVVACDVGYEQAGGGMCMDSFFTRPRNCYTFTGAMLTVPCNGGVPGLFSTGCAAAPGTSTCCASTSNYSSVSTIGTMVYPTAPKTCDPNGNGYDEN